MAPIAEGSLRAAQKHLTRRLLIDAALSEFAEKGFMGTTVNDIVRAAGTSRATFYLNFSSKYELVSEMRAELSPDFRERYRELDGVLATRSVEQFRAWVAHQFRWNAEHEVFIRVSAQISVAPTNVEARELTRHVELSEMTTYLAGAGREIDVAKSRIVRMVDDIWRTGRLEEREHLGVGVEMLVDEVVATWGPILLGMQLKP